MGAGADLSGMFSAFDGTPSFTTLDNVKSQPLQQAIDGQLSTYKGNVAANNKNLADFINQWNSGNATASANAGQEENAISGFYNGSVSTALAGQEASQAAALRAAGDEALKYATQNRNLGQLTSGTGNSSYNTRLGIGNANTINIQNALNMAQQRANDYRYVLGQQVGLAGARTNLANSVANRALVPAQARSSLQSSELGALGTIQSLNNANNFYGLSQNKSFVDQLGNFSGDALDLAENVAGEVMSSGMSSGGGNDPQLNSSQNPSINWSSSNGPSSGNAGYNWNASMMDDAFGPGGGIGGGYQNDWAGSDPSSAYGMGGEQQSLMGAMGGMDMGMAA